MTETQQLSDVLPEIVAWLKSTAEAGEAFVVDQAPLYAQEYVAWVFWSNAAIAVAWWSVGLLFLVVAAMLYAAMRNHPQCGWKRKNDHGKWVGDDSCSIPLVIGPSLFAFMFAYGSGWALDSIKAHIAPRVVIVEHVGEVLR